MVLGPILVFLGLGIATLAKHPHTKKKKKEGTQPSHKTKGERNTNKRGTKKKEERKATPHKF